MLPTVKIYFSDTCMIIIIASLPSHSATSLGAVFPYVQCVCSPAGFGLFFNVLLSFFISFLFSWLLQFYFILFGESGM